MNRISNKHVHAYFQCFTKSHLLLTGNRQYEQSEYELLNLKCQQEGAKNYIARLENSENYKEGCFKNGASSISGVKKTLSHLEINCTLLLKVPGKSSLGSFHYKPVTFIGNEIIQKPDLLELAFLGYTLELIQNKFPAEGIIVTKAGIERKINLNKHKEVLKATLSEIESFAQTPPKLILNKHCRECQFMKYCREKAIREDNLSLLDRITAKQISSLERKGIFTVKQLSFTYKQSKKSKQIKNSLIRYRPELQAIAIRTGKTFIESLPGIIREDVEIFLDIESVPNSLYYLFGILVIIKERELYYQLWLDTNEDEKSQWECLLNIFHSFPKAPIYHYGSLELIAIEKLSKKYKISHEQIKPRLINVNSFLFGKIYFPTYSNSLKDLGKFLGVKWSDEKASGLQSIVWRNKWELGEHEYKDILLTYNKEDILALKALLDELTRIKQDALVSADIDFIKNPKKISTEAGQSIHTQFELILGLAHHGYDRKKIKINFDQAKIEGKDKQKKDFHKGYMWLGKSLPKPNKTITFTADQYCYKHTDQKLNKSRITSKRVVIDVVFTKNGIRKTVTEYIGNHGFCPVCNNNYPPVEIRQLSRQLYGHRYIAWYVYQRIELQMPYSKINSTIYEIIKDKVASGYGSELIRFFSEFYKETEVRIIEKIINSPFVHVDETTVSILGENQYVWIFTTDKYVTYKLSKTREGSIPQNFLKDFKGILISDFFSGYDNIECCQQKCWVHLIRDLNNDLWTNPFDKDFENLVSEIKLLIVPIIQAVHEFGLKKYYLKKFEKNIKSFYSINIDNRIYKSEKCILYQKRFLRYRNSLFTFIENDGISWHNNKAENGIRHICVQRKISGSFGDKRFPEYLRMASIMQTCKLQNKSFFKFLLSKKKDIDAFS